MDDPSPLTPYGDRQAYVLFVGRLVEEKGLRTLLDAWRLAAPRHMSLRIAGDGPLRHLVEQFAEDDGSVEFLGWRSSAEIAKLQQEAMVTVVPSEWYEAGPPLVLLQALASGTPVLCCDLANICAGVTDAGAGLSFRTGDAASLSSRLTQILAGDADLLAMSGAARSVYEARHTPASTLATLERVYEEVAR
jgi:glycosyltransferase involved in cell wall biosynthesis